MEKVQETFFNTKRAISNTFFYKFRLNVEKLLRKEVEAENASDEEIEVVGVVKECSSFSNQLSNRHGRGLTSTSALDQHRTDTGQRTCRDEVPVAAWGDQRGG